MAMAQARLFTKFSSIISKKSDFWEKSDFGVVWIFLLSCINPFQNAILVVIVKKLISILIGK
jgi:predicted transcriptional regulator